MFHKKKFNYGFNYPINIPYWIFPAECLSLQNMGRENKVENFKVDTSFGH